MTQPIVVGTSISTPGHFQQDSPAPLKVYLLLLCELLYPFCALSVLSLCPYFTFSMFSECAPPLFDPAQEACDFSCILTGHGFLCQVWTCSCQAA